nr:hypothetical protein [Tanacetum cinerariifolium]
HFARDYRAKGNQDNRRRDARYNRNKARDNGRKHAYQDDSKALVTIDEEDINCSGHVEKDAQNYAMMAYSSSNSGSENKVKSCSKTCQESYARLKKLYDEQRDKLGDASVEITAYTLALKKLPTSLLHQPSYGILLNGLLSSLEALPLEVMEMMILRLEMEYECHHLLRLSPQRVFLVGLWFSENVGDVIFRRDLFNGDVAFLDIVPKEMVTDFDVFYLRVLHRVFSKVNRAFVVAHDQNIVESNVVVDKRLFHP